MSLDEQTPLGHATPVRKPVAGNAKRALNHSGRKHGDPPRPHSVPRPLEDRPAFSQCPVTAS